MNFGTNDKWGQVSDPTLSGRTLGVGSNGLVSAMDSQVLTSEEAPEVKANGGGKGSKPCTCHDKKMNYKPFLLGVLVGAAALYLWKRA